MKLCTPQIVWHDKDPIYSVDFHHERGSEWRLASGGTDKHVKVSYIAPADVGLLLEESAASFRLCHVPICVG